VDWMIAEGNYVRIHAGKERLYVRSSLGKLQSEFQSRSLLRIHRSCVVNIHRIREVRRKDNRHYLLILKDGATINCSRRCSRHLRSTLVTNVAR
jgi:two-component system LytT family response regulator